ncbi:decaprenyl-phosphate phosphoribosyltransferase [Vallitalea sp.]|jgi:4-hydroxybenzoate polyprenyltransferase|uniref:decaprenyl-phosphate phosphoribosyltransferase n=1 Tax=Vallitalea sp. TaxID=1882829 RepID=UPI0025D4E665|nr:decaprenyl-phosphate phosphoribosyltransferase [Vallitalea sp.]MCT4686478.1 decaprenyl-phosphate phosphoribosyltransferase [Vallitalea sp.]
MNYIKLIRPKQWIKNSFVFAALIFSKKFIEIDAIEYSILLFIYFTIISSIIYIFNDINDADNDKIHPKKKKRPIASGAISKRNAVFFMCILIIVSLIISIHFDIGVNIVIILYIINNIIYTTGFKNYIIIDVMMISIGFLLRVIAGALVLEVYISSWIIICTFFLSMLMGLGKRRSEIVYLEDSAASHRHNLKLYSIKLIDYMLNICVGCTLITYTLYSILEYDNKIFMITNMFVFYGIFRYVYLIFSEDSCKMPAEIIIEDKPLLINILSFGISCILILLYI